jgi:hypothetical protein
MEYLYIIRAMQTPRMRIPIERQIIVCGPSIQVGNMMQRITDELGIRLEELEPRVTLDFFSDSRVADGMLSHPMLPARDKWGHILGVLSAENPLVMATCEVPALTSLQYILNWIHENDEYVFAEHNYLTGDRETWAGSPWKGPADRPTADDFCEQWAFSDPSQDEDTNLPTPKGINLPTVLGDAGSRVRVGVFDSSPFIQTASWVNPLVIDWVDPSLSLTVTHLNVTQLSPGVLLPPNAQPYPSHGLAVAGLVHAVAPGSQIQLVRVLDDYVMGLESVAIAGLATFVAEATLAKLAGDIDGAVINLSLGVYPHPGQAPAVKVVLPSVLLGVCCFGFPVVASAGNNSWALAGPEAPQVPAESDWVIGVQASNVAGTRACFSNRGDTRSLGNDPRDVAAPGCGLVSLAALPPGYDYYTGTSFAAPLVAGLAARRILEPSVNVFNVRDKIIQASAPSPDPTLPNGIIQVG